MSLAAGCSEVSSRLCCWQNWETREKVILAIYVAAVLSLIAVLCVMEWDANVKIIVGCSAVGLHIAVGALYYVSKDRNVTLESCIGEWINAIPSGKKPEIVDHSNRTFLEVIGLETNSNTTVGTNQLTTVTKCMQVMYGVKSGEGYLIRVKCKVDNKINFMFIKNVPNGPKLIEAWCYTSRPVVTKIEFAREEFLNFEPFNLGSRHSSPCYQNILAIFQNQHQYYELA